MASAPQHTSRKEWAIRIMRVALLVVWVGFIWTRSLMQGPESDSESLAVVQLLSGGFSAVGITDVSLMNHVVRKTAHFLEYLVLGMLAVGALAPQRTAGPWRWVFLAAIVGVTPSIDETIQLSTAGRSGQVSDVLLDMCGAVCGVALALGIRALVRRSRTRHAS